MLDRLRKTAIATLARLLSRVLSRPEIQKQFAQALVQALDDEEVQQSLWSAIQYRPATHDHHWGRRPNSVEEARFRIATRETADYVTERMPGAPNFGHPYHVLNFCMDRLEMEGEILEFGVFTGATINHIAARTDRTVHGFDSFRGLPESWGNATAGRFDRQGRLPEVADNVELHIGWFEDTLPGFVEKHPGPVAFMHVDCDLYSSTRTVLAALRQQIVPGTMIVFDEYFNYPTWREHEYKAFQEFIRQSGKGYEYIAYADKGFSVAVRIL